MEEDLFIVEYEKVNSVWLSLDDSKRKVWGLLSLARIKVTMDEIIQSSPLTNKLLFETILLMCKHNILEQMPIDQQEVNSYHEELRKLYEWCLEGDEDVQNATNETDIKGVSGVTKHQIKYHICGIGLFLRYLLDPSIGENIGSTPTIAV